MMTTVHFLVQGGIASLLLPLVAARLAWRNYFVRGTPCGWEGVGMGTLGSSCMHVLQLCCCAAPRVLLCCAPCAIVLRPVCCAPCTASPHALLCRATCVHAVVPTGVATSLDIALSNLYLALVTLTFYTMRGCLPPPLCLPLPVSHATVIAMPSSP
ncbi:unnamed protein product [Closterium sp. NIES-65]|nr:unnamed protein product [Closterium sp. NIES-65]